VRRSTVCRLEVNDAQDQSGTHQVTAPGYDTMTGLGTPNGSAFIKDLRSGTKHAFQTVPGGGTAAVYVRRVPFGVVPFIRWRASSR
jgi:hypothetical protein